MEHMDIEFVTGVNFTTGACKTVAAASIAKIPFYGGTTVVAQNDLNQPVHSEDE